jgi:Fe-S-cluster formation regulator IscX/YfhJ
MSWEVPDSLSSLGFFLNYEFTNYVATWCISLDFVIPLSTSPPLLGFYDFTKISETTSPPDASPGILWFHSLHHHLMHLLGFYGLIHCITTCILWSHSLHHHLMHLLGFYDLTHYITTWCISWDFMISLPTSPFDASPGILWFHSLHHHLMHLLGFYDLTHYITTWCISWDFMISLTASPPDASPRILWSHSLHHHLMHLLGFCDLTHCITTWCIS